MLRINRQTDYAVRVVLSLSKKPAGQRVPTSEIQAEMLIPPAFLQRIVATLANEKFIVTQPGRDGGITLARAPEEINLLQVVEAFEGPIWLSDCVEHLQSCVFGQTCPVNRRWARLRDVIRTELESATFAHLMDEANVIQQSLLPIASI
jgi:Rrf2 family protein